MRVRFARCYFEIQMILFRGKDTGGEIGEGTGRVVGFVEIKEDAPVCFGVCDEVAPSGVGFVCTGGV